ncbi:MAG: hypothetical protein ABIG39_02690 [Candidatus Micrarchaeota archaeon]
MIEFPFTKKNGSTEEKPSEQQDAKKCDDVMEDHEKCKLRAALLRHIIERYREQIEMGETKTVSGLRNLVNPKDSTILKTKESITDEFRPYIYAKNFEEAAKKAFEFVRDDMGNDVLPVDFWLSPSEMLELKVADEMDKAIFLCSLIIALDNETARIIVETNGHRHAFVVFDFEGKFHLMDPAHNVNASGQKDEVLTEHMKNRDSKPTYEFNNKGYNEL